METKPQNIDEYINQGKKGIENYDSAIAKLREEIRMKTKLIDEVMVMNESLVQSCIKFSRERIIETSIETEYDNQPLFI